MKKLHQILPRLLLLFLVISPVQADNISDYYSTDVRQRGNFGASALALWFFGPDAITPVTAEQVEARGKLLDGQKEAGERLALNALFTVGQDNNVLGGAQSNEESLFAGLDVGAVYQPNHFWKLAFGISERYYEDAPWSKAGSDNRAHSYTANSQFIVPLGDNLHFANNTNLVYGDLGNIRNNDPVNGPLERTRVWARSDSSFIYRPTGGGLNDQGWQFSGRHQLDLYNQSGYSGLDNITCTAGAEVAYIVNQDLKYWGGLHRIGREWEDNDLDSEGYRVEAGISGLLPCGARYRVALNHESQNYDNPSLKDRNMFGYSVLVEGDIGEFDWGVYSNYGFMNPNLPNSSWLSFANASGKSYGSFLRRKFGEDYLATLFCYGLFLDGEIFDSQDTERNYTYTGLTVQRDLGGGSVAGVTIGYSQSKYEWGGSSDTQDAFFGSFFYKVPLGE